MGTIKLVGNGGRAPAFDGTLVSRPSDDSGVHDGRPALDET